MGNINDLLKEMKSSLELEAFAEQQYKTILELNKKNSELVEKLEHLEGLLAQTNPLVVGEQFTKSTDPEEKKICEVQLGRLNVISMDRELTAEESKKVETYSKILATFRNKEKAPETPLSKTTTAELLKLVRDNE